MTSTSIYNNARDQYAEYGVDTEAALAILEKTPISLHCWQGDDVVGFEENSNLDGSGLQVTGNYPGRARTIDELRVDAEKALSLIPGKHRFNLHAIYGDFGGKEIERDEIEPVHFQSWIDWAKGLGLGLDFNPTFFAHPQASDGYTLANRDPAIREFWIAHGKACRNIAAAMGEALERPTVCNIWIPDGSKDRVADRAGPRQRLLQSLDAILQDKMNPAVCRDAVESKLFGIGSESYVVGSLEFYLGYAVSRSTGICLDAGHFHPTESLADKISAVMNYVPHLLLHVSRGVRWDSDHVVIQDDATQDIFRELVQGSYLDKTALGLDFFDASINRLAAWVIGTRAALKTLLYALLEPTQKLRSAEESGRLAERLQLYETSRTLPWGLVWEEYCYRQGVPGEKDWMREVDSYERSVLSNR